VIQQFSIRSGLVKRMRSQTATARLTIFLARRIDSGSLGIVNDKGRYLQEPDTAHLRGPFYDLETPEVAKRSHFQCSPKTSSNLSVILRP